MVRCSLMCGSSWSAQLFRSSHASRFHASAARRRAPRARRISRYAASRRPCSACASSASYRTPVQRTPHAAPAADGDMCVDHGGAFSAPVKQPRRRNGAGRDNWSALARPARETARTKNPTNSEHLDSSTGAPTRGENAHADHQWQIGRSQSVAGTTGFGRSARSGNGSE